jgi:transcriptional regulator of acetoin/glycerol metabolism
MARRAKVRRKRRRGIEPAVAKIRREAQALMGKIRRAERDRIGALDSQIERLSRQRQALASQFAALIDGVLRATGARRGGKGAPGWGGAVVSRGKAAARLPWVGRVLGARGKVAAPETITLREMEREHIAAVLESCGWNQTVTARRLGIGRNTLMRKIKTYGLQRRREAA